MLRLLNISFIFLLLFSCEHAKFDTLNNQIISTNTHSQKMNERIYDHGSNIISDIQSEVHTTKHSLENSLKTSKLEYMLRKMNEIDSNCSSVIHLIDSIKIELLIKAKEDSKFYSNNPKIVLNKFSLENGSLPINFDLELLKNKDNGEIVNDLLTKKNKPSEMGIELWEAIIQFREKVVASTGSYSWGKKSFSISPKAINQYSTKQELTKKIETMIDASKTNLIEDRQILIDLYRKLTKKEKSDVGIHWINQHFSNTTIPGAFNILSSLQYDILMARDLGLMHWKSKSSICGYFGFTQILPLVKGPNTAIEGEDINLTVFIGAFDQYNQPTVTSSSPESFVSYPINGTGNVRLNLKKGLHHLQGTVSIRNKSGVEKTENWEWTVNVMEK